ncbi:MAG: hypothetical protein KBC21_03525 [Candidatus Pacebacteria bacterium]|jgi:hypothetical protein|nr:hypothetical protein [Candidatus Paceibacterota bacterium]
MILPINTDNKKVPTKIKSKSFVAEILTVKDVDEDYKNVIENEKLIKRTRGSAGGWPNPKKLTLEENRIDLSWHQREFENNTSFAFVLKSRTGEYMGCAYLYPMNFRSKLPDAKKYEVDFSFWINGKFYDLGLYALIKGEWMEILKKMGFKKIYYSNKI